MMSDRQESAGPGGTGRDAEFCHFFFFFKLALAPTDAL